MALACALLTPSVAFAAPKPLTPETARTRIVKRGLGNWVGVQITSGAAFGGRIVSIDEQSFSLQLHNDPEITPVMYSDVVYLQTGLTRGQGIGFIVAPIALAAVGIGVMIAMHNNAPKLPTLPTLPNQPVFP